MTQRPSREARAPPRYAARQARPQQQLADLADPTPRSLGKPRENRGKTHGFMKKTMGKRETIERNWKNRWENILTDVKNWKKRVGKVWELCFWA